MAILIDSDVLIWYIRGHVGAQTRLESVRPWRISVITYLELAQGCRNKDELHRLKIGFARKETQVLPLTPAVSDQAMYLIDTYALSSGLRLADALVAATAIDHDLIMLTANRKHFSMIDGIGFEQFVP